VEVVIGGEGRGLRSRMEVLAGGSDGGKRRRGYGVGVGDGGGGDGRSGQEAAVEVTGEERRAELADGAGHRWWWQSAVEHKGDGRWAATD
jgi:hypothetical protein